MRELLFPSNRALAFGKAERKKHFTGSGCSNNRPRYNVKPSRLSVLSTPRHSIEITSNALWLTCKKRGLKGCHTVKSTIF